MKAKPALRALRRRFAEQARPAPISRPAVSLGAFALDQALPDQGLAVGALHECLPAAYGDYPAAIGFGIGLLGRILRIRRGGILWAAPSYQAFRHGGIYPVGLTAFGLDPDRVIQVSALKTRDVLWALEEGLANTALAAVIGVLPENDRAYDFTASRRLSMRAAKNGVTAFLVRNQSACEMSTVAETRWSVAAAPSEARRRIGHAQPGLGAPRWQVRLTKSKRGTPGSWRVEWDDETLSFRMAAPVADRTPVPARGGQQRAWVAAS